MLNYKELAENILSDVMNNGSISDILLKTKIFASKRGDKKLLDWVSKELGEQLIIDIAKYQSHPNCRCLYCFVYDPEGIIRNPRGIEKDLAELGKGFLVKVFIRPE